MKRKLIQPLDSSSYVFIVLMQCKVYLRKLTTKICIILFRIEGMENSKCDSEYTYNNSKIF